MWGKIAWRLFWRELSRGELWVIAFSLFLAVLTVVSLSGITESVRSALYQRSANFVAADKILRSSVGFNEQVYKPVIVFYGFKIFGQAGTWKLVEHFCPERFKACQPAFPKR